MEDKLSKKDREFIEYLEGAEPEENLTGTEHTISVFKKPLSTKKKVIIAIATIVIFVAYFYRIYQINWTMPTMVSPPILTDEDCPGLGFLELQEGDYAVLADEKEELPSEVKIPETYDDNVVTSIYKRAFYECSNITSIVIPDSITNIGFTAFYGCSNLTNIKYRGTEEQWNAISKGEDWDRDTGNYTIIYNYTGE